MMVQSSAVRSVTILLSLWTNSSTAWPNNPSSSLPTRIYASKPGNPPPSTNLPTRAPDSTVDMPTESIQNFRRAACIQNVYRCASPDILGEKLMASGGDSTMTSSDKFVFHEVGLVLDLRSPSERQELQSQVWTKKAHMKVFETNQAYVPSNRRCVVRIDVLSPQRFMKYIEENWLTPAERAQAAWYKVADGGRLHEFRIERLNERGLAGLNEAILETGKVEMRQALETITEHLEGNRDQKVIIHCVQGKDRTGMLIMLLQSILGVPDAAIVADYFQSNQMLEREEGSAAANEIRPRGRLDRNIFSGTNPEAILATLQHLRQKYGSISPGYLDHIGFDEAWRKRLGAVLIPDNGLAKTPSSRL